MGSSWFGFRGSKWGSEITDRPTSPPELQINQMFGLRFEVEGQKRICEHYGRVGLLRWMLRVNPPRVLSVWNLNKVETRAGWLFFWLDSETERTFGARGWIRIDSYSSLITSFWRETAANHVKVAREVSVIRTLLCWCLKLDSEHDEFYCNTTQADQLVHILSAVTVLMGGDDTKEFTNLHLRVLQSYCFVLVFLIMEVGNLQRVGWRWFMVVKSLLKRDTGKTKHWYHEHNDGY